MHTRGNSSLTSITEALLPPSPAIPVFTRPPYPHVEKNYEVDPEQLKPGVIKDLQAVSDAWAHSASDIDLETSDKYNGDVDVLSNLKLTTRAIRSVRNYLVSLPDESTVPVAEKETFRARSFTPAPVRRVVSNPNSQSDPLSLIRRSALDVLIVLRALEESARLPLSDEAYDAQSDHGSSQDASSNTYSRGTSPYPPGAMSAQDSESEKGLTFDADTSVAFSLVSVPGRKEGVPVWADEEEEDLFGHDENEKREVWDERLVLGGGWLYKPDIKLKDLRKEREAIGRYLDTVDDALFGGTKGAVRGWERVTKEKTKHDRDNKAKSRRTSTANGDAEVSKVGPMHDLAEGVNSITLSQGLSASVIEEADEEDIIDDDDLPGWAKRTTFNEDPLGKYPFFFTCCDHGIGDLTDVNAHYPGRLHALLVHLLPGSLLPLLPPANATRIQLLDSLSSGQLLCIAYNTGVRRSKKPWGYISKDAVHDIAAIEAKAAAEAAEEGNRDGDAVEKRRKGWTFRRTDNLRLWAG